MEYEFSPVQNIAGLLVGIVFFGILLGALYLYLPKTQMLLGASTDIIKQEVKRHSKVNTLPFLVIILVFVVITYISLKSYYGF